MASTTAPQTWAIVPLKLLDQAKARLAHILSGSERRGLMLTMARDVLTALSQSKALTGTLIVSRAPEADALAQAFATQLFAESPTANLPQALTQAGTYVAEVLNGTGVMIIPADVPLISGADVDSLLATHQQITIVGDEHQIGTNCLVCSPPNSIPMTFDGRSFAPHVASAEDSGLPLQVVTSAGFALDIDTPDDLRALIGRNPSCQTAVYLEKSGIASRL